MTPWSLALAALLAWGAGAKENLQYWREVRLGRADVAELLGDCYRDEDRLRACVAAVDGAGQWARPPKRTAADVDLTLENTPADEAVPAWPAQHRARRQAHDALRTAIRKHFERGGPHLDFLARLDALARLRRREIPEGLFWSEAYQGALRTTDGFASLTPHAQNADDSRGEEEAGGFGLSLDYLSRGVVVHHVHPDSPADAAGLRAEDRVIAFAVGTEAFKPLDETAAARVTELNLLPLGATLRALVERDGQRLELSMVRGTYSVPQVQEAYKRGVGYVRLRSFDESSACLKVAYAIEELTERGARGLVLDLRGNGGGNVLISTCVAGLFVGNQTVIGFMKDGNLTWRTSGFSSITALPLVLLVDGESASGSEAVAGALQVARRAWLVGERTAGKATRQNVRPFKGGLDIAQTDAYFVLPDGRTHQGVGITPDFTQPYRAGASDDDRFYLRVDDRVFDYPTPRGTPWTQTRPGSVARIEACVPTKLIPALDHQLAYAEAVLRCEGVTENVTPTADKP